MRSVIIAGTMMFGVLSGTAEAQSRWTFRQMTEPMTDEVRGIAAITSGQYTLVVKCDYGMNVYVSLYSRVSAMVGSSSARMDKPILHRFGSSQPITFNWRGDRVIDDYILLDDALVAEFTRGLMSSDRLAVRIAQSYGSPDDVTFPLAGSSAAINNVYRVCGQARP